MSERAERGGGAAAWHELAERGSAWGLAVLAAVYRRLGRAACLAAMAPVVLYFYATDARRRRASLDYLRRVRRAGGRGPEPGLWEGYRHYFAFGASLVDKLGAWTGNIRREDIAGLDSPEIEQLRADPRGALLLSAHVGSTDIFRAVGAQGRRRPVTIVAHTANAERYNRMIARRAPESQVRIVPAAGFGLGSAMAISAAVERGEWVVVMADRAAVGGGRTLEAPLLGDPVRLPEGPFLLAAILQCPVHVLLCLEEGGRRRLRLTRLAEAGAASRRDRPAHMQMLARRYAQALEDAVRAAPYQWFNFYDFWAADPGEAGARPEAAP